MHKDLEYLENKPKRVNYQKLRGPDLHPLQLYDLVYDDKDLRIRQIKGKFGDFEGY